MHLNTKGVQMLDQALAGIQAKNSADTDNAQAQRERYFKMLLSTLPASQQQATLLSNPNWQNAPSVSIPDYQPTPDDQLHGIAIQDAINNYKNLPQSTRQQATFRLGVGADASADTIKLLNAQDVTGNPQNWTPQVQQRQAIEDKRSMDANQQEIANQADRKFNQIDMPTSSANIGHVKAMTVERLAAAGNQRAQAGKNVAETAGVNAKTQALTTGGALAAPDNPIVQGLVTRTYDPALMRRFTEQQQGALFGAAQQIDPTVNTSDYQVQFGVKRGFNSGKEADAVRSINQLVGHINQLNNLKDQLDNSNVFPALTNTVSNAVAGQTSPRFQRAANAYDVTAGAVSNELEKMLRGSSQSGVAERQKVMNNFGVNKSPSSIDGGIGAALNLMASRADELRDQYQKGVGRPADFTLLNPESEAILRKMPVDQSLVDRLAGKMAPNPQRGGARSATTKTIRYDASGKRIQ